MAWNPRLLLALVLIVAGSSCTATRTREFTREAYESAAESPARSRVFEAGQAPVRAALIEELGRRGAAFDEAPPEGLLARVPWMDTGEASASVDLGQLRQVIARTERSYRSWLPADFGCDACIVRNGRLTAQKTELVEDAVRRVDPGRYRVEASVRARFEEIEGGTMLELQLELAVAPPGPNARSTGRLEARLLDAIEAALLR